MISTFYPEKIITYKFSRGGNSMKSNKIKTSKKKNVNNVAYFFLIPFITVFLIFNVYPVLRTLQLSFTNYKGYGEAVFVGLNNYKRAITDKFFIRSVINTFRMWIPNIVMQLGMALLLTVIFSDIKYRMKGLGLFRALFYLPNLIAATSVAFLFRTLLDWRFGTINQILMGAGISAQPTDWLGSPNTAPYAVAIISAWMWFGNSFIVLMAGVQGISQEYFEAARIDGAGRWQMFTGITMPLLKPILLYVTITSLIGGIQMFDIPFLISDGTNGSPGGILQTSMMYVYKFGFEAFQVGYASAASYLIFLLILILSLLQFRMYKKGGEI